MSSPTHSNHDQGTSPPTRRTARQQSRRQHQKFLIAMRKFSRRLGLKGNDVMVYLVVLFAISFTLMFLSYLIQQRNSEATISTLQYSMSSLQSVDGLVQANETLYEQVSILQEELNALVVSEATYRAQTVSLTDQLVAMDWLWRIQRTYSRWEHDECRALVDAFEASGLTTSLPTTSPSGVSGSTPAQQYTALLDALDYLDEP